MKYLFPVLAIFFLSVAFSCKSAAPPPVPEDITGSDLTADEKSSPQETPAESGLTVDEQSASQGTPAEVPETGDVSSLSAGEGSAETDLGKPDAALPPAAPAEEKPELPEPRPPVFQFPQAETPSFKMTAIPPPPVVPRSSPQESTEELQPGGKAPDAQVQTPPVPPPQIQPPPQAAVPAPPPPVSRTPPEPPPPVSGEPPQAVVPAPPPPVSRTPPEPPSPPSFLRPAEPETPPPVRQPVPMPVNPLPELPARTPPETPEDQVVFSRVVRATVGQVVEIPFRGTGWVYLGELGNRRGIAYDSRRLDIGSSAGVTEGQSFIFHAEAAGTYILKFYKQDFIQDYIINDYVQVIVGEASEDTASRRTGFPVDPGRVVAEPRWPPPGGADAVPAPAADAQNSPPSAGTDTASGKEPTAGTNPAVETGSAQRLSPAPATSPVPGGVSPGEEANPATGMTPGVETIPAPETGSAAQTQPPPPEARPRQTTTDDSIVPIAPPKAVSSPDSSAASVVIPPDAAPADYVRLAKQEFDAGRVESALTILDTMKQRYPSGTDEAWWLYGQLLEANSPSRDIRLAQEYYNRLIGEYPQSNRVGDARRRIAYLQRYYFNIR